MRHRLVLSSIAALAAAQLQCGPPPDDTGTEGEDWCATAAPRDLWACEAAMQRRLLGSSTPRHGCDAAAPSTTAVAVGSRDTVPHAQTWADLRWASYEGGSFLLHDPSGALFRGATATARGPAPPRDRLLGASKWGLFFHDGGDASRGVVVDEPYAAAKCHVAFAERLYVLNLLTTQVGHLLVDVLEPLFYDAERSGGGAVDPARTRISIQVHVERRSLHRRLMDAIYGDTPFALLRLFTRHPIHTKDALDGLPGRLCLPSAAVELDITDAYYARGHDAREANRTAAAPEASEVRRYRRFRQFLRDGLRHDVTRPPKTVVFVERKGQRELLNGDALKDATARAATAAGLRFRAVALEDIGFSEQLELFGDCALLVAQYGSALHNVLFLPDAAVVLMLPMPKWCDESWHFERQAYLLGHAVVRVCAAGDDAGRRVRWARRAARQGPWHAKDADFAVPVATFEAGLRAALADDVTSATFRAPPPPPLHPEDLVTPRVHVTDARVEAGTVEVVVADHGGAGVGDVDADALARVRFVVEVVLSDDGAPPDSREREFLARVDAGRVELCLTPAAAADPNTDVACFSANLFNEFSTVDAGVVWGDRVVFRFWLRDVDEGDLPGSETFFGLDVDGPYDGLGASTITHLVDGPLPSSKPRSKLFSVPDWRRFRASDVVELEVVLDDESLPLVLRPRHPTAVQARVAAFCRNHKLPRGACADVALAALREVRGAAAAIAVGLPLVQRAPTPERPFVFLHHEKCAGSSLRRYLVRAAKKRGVGFFVPCYDGGGVYREDERCYAFDLSNATAASGGAPPALAATAGHFNWGVWDALPSSKHDPPPCLSLVRHPIDRAISLFYERVYQRDDHLGGRRLNDWSVSDFEWLLGAFKGSAFSMWRDEGFCDQVCKNLLGLAINRGRTPAAVDALPADVTSRAASSLDAALAIERLETCVVGTQEDWAGARRAIDHWFPWLSFDDDVRRNVGFSDAETRQTLRPELSAAIEKCNACDLAVYEAATRRVEVQKEFLDERAAILVAERGARAG